jgi:threonine/homoserine/homoserine lactone efflux protein
MDAKALVSLLLFSLVISITPGPNNLLLASSGLAYGFRRTVPAIGGVLLGVALLFVVNGAGMGAVLTSHAGALVLFKCAGAVYLLYLAVHLWSASALSDAVSRRPFRLIQVAAFQFLNPKAWMIVVSAISLYVAESPHYWARLGVVGAVYLAVSLPAISVWAGFGALLKRQFQDPARARRINRGMACVTVASALLVFLW